MAKPIKETPVLKGKDAVNFIKSMKKAEKTRVDKSVKKRMTDNFKSLNAIAQF
ncbi:MAG: hypothetical protein JKY52_12445 [Flavobacteriales bacterium]|nr:hypothetical protein [Flavobacteriales bacterium]